MKKLVFGVLVFLLFTAGVFGQTTTNCTTCNGTGRITTNCVVCGGSGTRPLYTWAGVINTPDAYCNGTGKQSSTCTTCNGTGRITVAAPAPATPTAPATTPAPTTTPATATGPAHIMILLVTKPCPTCEGTGIYRPTCFLCNGTGGYSALGYWWPCQNCGGTGKDFLVCPECKGATIVSEWVPNSNYDPNAIPPDTNPAPVAGSPSTVFPSTGSSSTGSSSSSGSSNIDVGQMVRNYQNMGRNVEQALDNYRNAVRRGATQSERDNLRNNVINQQQRMRQYRLECNSRGASIAADYYETVSP